MNTRAKALCGLSRVTQVTPYSGHKGLFCCSVRSTQNALYFVDPDNLRGTVRTPCGINVLVGICRPSLRSPYTVTATIPEAAEQDQEQHIGFLPTGVKDRGTFSRTLYKWLTLGTERQCTEYKYGVYSENGSRWSSPEACTEKVREGDGRYRLKK